MNLLRCKRAPFIFKFGITTNAAQRWDHPIYGYKFEKTKWRQMLVIHLSSEPFTPAMLEAALIEKYRRSLISVENLFGLVCPRFFKDC